MNVSMNSKYSEEVRMSVSVTICHPCANIKHKDIKNPYV